jgi:hypothetical protein
MKRLLAVLRPHIEDGATIMLLLFLCVAVAIFFVHAALAAGQPNTSNAPTTR